MLLPHRSTKKRPALLADRLTVDVGTALRHALGLEQAAHGIHSPESSIYAVSRVIFTPGRDILLNAVMSCF